ncbi:MAG: SpoIIE family protein phosphatase [Anaerolineae bacterium]
MTKAKILIVDDEPYNIDYLEQELEDLEYETFSASSGPTALEKVTTANPDVILLDIMMPGMDGFQVLEQLKAHKTWRTIPVIVISALNDLASVVKGIKLGAEDYLPKPFNEVLLKARLDACLEKKRLRDQEHQYLKGLERELEIGRQIQAGFLPEKLPQWPGWEFAAHFQAAREVAGDFYDVFALPQEQRFGLMVGDVCGKGVGAALFMTLFRSLIRATANLNDFLAQPSASVNPDDATILQTAVGLTNNYIARLHSRSNMYASLFFGLLDPATGQLTYLNGGHEPPFIITPTGIKARLTPTGPIVGLIPNANFIVQTVQLESADILLIVTDGVTDAHNPAGQRFTHQRLLSLLAPPVSSASAILNTVNTHLRNFIADEIQFDDITMLAVRRQSMSSIL